MLLLKPYFEIITDINAISILKEIEKAARTCYKSEDKITETSAANLVKFLIEKGHESAIEHQSISVRFICDRGVTHEIVRHRLASYSQESTRYCNYSGGVSFIIPNWLDIKQGEYNFSKLKALKIKEDAYEWLQSMLIAEEKYLKLLKLGWSAQKARSVLPNSLKTEIVMTANLREWRHVFILRTSKAAHPQMQEIMLPLLDYFQKEMPVIFNDIK